MSADAMNNSQPVRASGTRGGDGPKFIGGYEKKTGNTDLRFVEGQLPEDNGRIVGGASPPREPVPACRASGSSAQSADPGNSGGSVDPGGRSAPRSSAVR